MTRRFHLGQVFVFGLCLLLALFLCAEAVHSHADAAADGGAHCPLCLLSHAAAMPVALAALYVAQRVLARLLVLQPRRGSPSLARTFCIRPPPAFA